MFSLVLAFACTPAELEPADPDAAPPARDTGTENTAPDASPELNAARPGIRPAAPPFVPQRTVVVGGGPAGLAVAMDLAGPVVLLEATDALGGRGRLSGGLSLFPASADLTAFGVTLTPDDLLADWERLTGAPPTAATAAWLGDGEAVHDRLQTMGVVWSIGQPDPILHRWWLHQPERGGEGLTDALIAALPDSVEVRLAARVTGLRFADGRVTGVDTDAGPVLADTVVLATGGFVNRLDLLHLAVADAVGTIEAGTDPFAQGDALDWATRFGLGTANLDAIGWSAGLVATPGADGGPIRIASGSVTPWFWVDETGERFVDESQGWSVLPPGAERRHTNVWAIGNYERWVGSLEDPLDFPGLDAAKLAGDVIRCDPDPAALAGLIGADPDGLVATFAAVAQINAGTLVDPYFRRPGSFGLEPGTTCAFRVGHQAMKGFGGVAVTGDGEVMDTTGAVVPGLWSVGEAAGMAVPGMGGGSGWDGSLSAVIWSGWRAAAAINTTR